MSEEFHPSRRIVFQGLGALGVAAVLAGCSDDTGGNGAGDDGPADGGASSPGGGGSSAGTAGEVLATTSEIPVGGGIILAGKKLVITQPTAGEFKAFSAICKHQGFDVTSVEAGTIICNVHGSEYDAATGEVTKDPAPTGLDPVEIKVEGDNILAA